MKTLNLEQMEVIEGGKFWGTGYSSSWEMDPNCASGWAVVGYKEYWVLGIKVSSEEDGRFCYEGVS
ncbi:hypothetical protein DBR43_27505 [Pedobacter sp. KBW06]|uniref:hypothetical protein n=1 Tax=Pedobacter sp. KBW06 TaxID=2153359 RepID=UPI000F5B5E2A|nr:hypothetical protein [Pedobacter sp. KBW06]RQO65993.1 hypothetical protein DBR43_27505 [Pedobacter sp. KBW06]